MAKLIVNPNAPSRREATLVRGALTIGRDPGNDLVLPDAMVSRRHAVVEYRNGRYALRDCNSSNGSLVNGGRIFEHVLRDGDVVAIGTARLLFRDDPEQADASGKVLRHPAARRMQCPTCETEFRAGDSFCRQCGRQLEEVPLTGAVCASCGARVRFPARFCSACGVSLPEEGQATPAAGLLSTSIGLGSREAAPLGSGRFAAGLAQALPSADVIPDLLSHPDSTSPPVRSAHARAVDAAVGERILAGLIDGLIVGLGQALLLAPLAWAWAGRDVAADVAFVPVLLTVLALLATGLAGASYFVYFWGSRGATPGKRALGLVVQDGSGACPIGLPRAALRFLGYVASALFLGVGFLMIALDGAGLHDRLAGTRVVRHRS